MTLTEFLLARIAEDEERARRRISAISDRTVVVYATRVLAECEAKRRIVEWATAGGRYSPTRTHDADVLRLLALPYADHPDYREEWKP